MHITDTWRNCLHKILDTSLARGSFPSRSEFSLIPKRKIATKFKWPKTNAHQRAPLLMHPLPLIPTREGETQGQIVAAILVAPLPLPTSTGFFSRETGQKIYAVTSHSASILKHLTIASFNPSAIL